MIAMSLLVAIAGAQILRPPPYLHTRAPREELLPARRLRSRRASFQRPKPIATPATAPVKVPAVAGVPPATVKRAPVQPTSVAGTLLQLAKGFRERGDTTMRSPKCSKPARSIRQRRDSRGAGHSLRSMHFRPLERGLAEVTVARLGGRSALRLADLKLRVGVPTPGNAARRQRCARRCSRPNRAIATGIPDGSTFGISELTLKRQPDPEAETRLLLRVGVKERAPTRAIDRTKVQVQVYLLRHGRLNDQVPVADIADGL